MKKLVLVLLLSVASLSSVRAQGFDPRFFNNQFVTLGGGVAMYNNETAVTNGTSFEFSIGNWILRDMALRFQFGMMNAENPRGVACSYYNGHCDFQWDAIGTISGMYNPKRIFSVYPEIGFGIVYRPGYMRAADSNSLWDLEHMTTNGQCEERMDPDFMAMVGATFEFRIPRMRQWPLFIDAKMFLLPQNYDFNTKNASFYDITFGIKHDIRYDPTHKRLPGESRGWNYDWFVGVAAGPNFSIMDIQSADVSAGNRLGWNVDATFGRNFSSLWSVRFGLGMMTGTTEQEQGIEQAAVEYDYKFYNLRADLMFNISNINGFRRGRRFNLIPYAGCGLISRFDATDNAMGADAGMIARVYLSSNFDFYADARYLMVPPRFNWGHNTMDNGFCLVNFGLIYNFEPSSCRYAKAAFRLRN